MEMLKKTFAFLSRCALVLDKIDSRLFIFLVLCLGLLSFTPCGNEEAYFSLAKQYIDPSWIPGSFTFTEWVGTRFLFQNIAGWALKYLSFEQLTFWGRMVNFLLYAFPLSLIFKYLKIGNLGILVVLSIFIQNIDTQHFLGKEWMFSAFESKTLAYIFVFYGYYFLLTGKYKKASLFAAFASYFHVLVGGWFFVLVFLYTALRERNIKLLFFSGCIYLLTVLPFVAFLAMHIVESGSVINGIDIDWVYSFFRNTHHTAPMHTQNAMETVLPRVIVSFVLLLLSVFYFRKIKNDESIRQLNDIAMISLCMVFVGLLLTYIDVNGHILKYYLFRIASIGAFTYYLILLLFLRKVLLQRFKSEYVIAIVFVLAIAIFSLKVEKNISKAIRSNANQDIAELAEYVKENTGTDDVFLFLDNEELSFSRRVRRESLVIFKFDPGGGEKIYEWYMREKMRDQLQKDITYLDTITQKYRLDFLIADKVIDYERLRLVYNNDKFYLYEINGRTK